MLTSSTSSWAPAGFTPLHSCGMLLAAGGYEHAHSFMLDVAAGRLTRAEWLKRHDLHQRLQLYGRCAWHAALQARRCWKAAADVPAMDEEV